MTITKRVSNIIDGVLVTKDVALTADQLTKFNAALNKKPTDEEVAEKAEYDEKVAVRADTFVTNFIAMTPAQVTSYVDTNVKDLPSAKSVIQKLALMVLVLAKSGFKE